MSDSRIFTLSLPSGSVTAMLVLLLLELPCCAQDQNREQWKAQLEQRRIQAIQQANQQPTPAPEAETAGEKRGIMINGKLVPSRKRPAANPAANPEIPSASAALSPAVVAESTAAVAPPAAPAAVPTPGVVKIKKTKIIGGKIITVEIEATPTPSPAGAAPGAVTDATQAAVAADAAVASVTGVMAELREKLLIASKSPTGSMRFESRLIGKMREEFMLKKGQPHAAGIMPATREVMIQSNLQRLSSVARGGNIDNETAQILLKVLFPPERPTPKAPDSPTPAAASATPGQPAAEAPPEQPSGQAAPQQAGEQPAAQPQYYLDQYGRYVYADGTPVLDANGQEIYYQEPQGYYDENGVYQPYTY